MRIYMGLDFSILIFRVRIFLARIILGGIFHETDPSICHAMHLMLLCRVCTIISLVNVNIS